MNLMHRIFEWDANPPWEVGVARFGVREVPLEGEARAPVPRAPRLRQSKHIGRWEMTKRTEQCRGAPSSLIFAIERRTSLKIEKKRKPANEIETEG